MDDLSAYLVGVFDARGLPEGIAPERCPDCRHLVAAHSDMGCMVKHPRHIEVKAADRFCGCDNANGQGSSFSYWEGSDYEEKEGDMTKGIWRDRRE